MLFIVNRSKKAKNSLPALNPGGRKPHWGRRLAALAVLVALILATTAYFHFTSDETISRLSIETLEEMTGGQVKLANARFTHLSEIQIQGMRVHTKATSYSEENPILTSEEILVRIEPVHLLMGKLTIREIIIQQGQFKIWYDRDRGVSNLELLDFGEPDDEPMFLPAIYFRDCGLEYVEIDQGVRGPKIQQQISGKIRPLKRGSDHYELLLESGEQSLVNHARMEGLFDVTGQSETRINLSFHLQSADLSSLPAHLSRVSQLYEKTKPDGLVALDWTYHPQAGYNLELVLENGMMRLPISQLNTHLQNVQAKVKLHNDIIEIEHLEGNLEDHCDFYAHGSIFGYDEMAAMDLTMGTQNLEVPANQWVATAEISEKSAFINRLNEWMPWGFQRILNSLLPTGKIDFEVQAKRGAGASRPVRYYGSVICHKANLIYEKFPYPLQNIAGRAWFDPNQVVVGPMITKYDDMQVVYEGYWLRQDDQLNYEMTVDVKNGPLDRRLYQALNPEQQALWDLFLPKNRVNAVYKNYRTANEESRWQLDVDLLDVDAAYQGFAIPMSHIQGTMKMTRDEASINVHSAKALGGDVTLTGTYRYRNQVGLESDIQFKDAAIDQQFIEYMPPGLQTRYHDLVVEGLCDGEIKIRSQPDADAEKTFSADLDISAQLRNSRVDYLPLKYPLSDVDASIQLANEKVIIHSLAGRHHDSDVTLRAEFLDPNTYNIHVEGQRIVLDDEMERVVSRYEPDLWQTLHPGGRVNLALEITQNPDHFPARITGSVETLDASFRWDKIDYDFEHVAGEILIEPDWVVFEDVSSQTDQARFVLSGRWPRQSPNAAELYCRGKDIAVDDKLLTALPETLRGYLKEIELAGNLAIDVHVSHQATPNEKGPWDIKGWIELKQGQLSVPFKSDAIQVLGNGSLHYEPESELLRIEGSLQEGSALILQRPLVNAQMQIAYTNQDDLLVASDIGGVFCDGQLSGQARLMLGDEGPGYELQLAARQVDIKPLLEADKPQEQRSEKLRGYLMGEYNLSKKDAQSPRKGFFQFYIDKAVLGELPFAATFLYVPNLSWPKEGAFNEIQIHGNVIDQVVRFDSLFLRGSAMSLQGVGEMTEPGHMLDLIFLVGSPHDLPPVPGFTDLFTAIKPALLHLRVKGTFDHPQVDTIAFSSFQNFLRYFSGTATQLLNGSR